MLKCPPFTAEVEDGSTEPRPETGRPNSAATRTTMPETIKCVHCEAPLRLPEQFIGQEVRCPSCQKTFTARLPPEPPPRSRPAPVPRDEPSARRRPREIDEDDVPSGRRRPRTDDDDDD